MSSEWLEGHELAEKYTTEDFVGLFGYEMTWSNGLGHMNTFNTPGFQSYTRALDKGWHVAPTNNQDNHKGKWGDANTARSVVLADSLTEENIYDAMRNCRVYATEDNDLNIYYTLDSYVMGTVLNKDMVGEQIELKVDLQDATDSKIGKVEIIVNGGLSIASQDASR